MWFTVTGDRLLFCCGGSSPTSAEASLAWGGHMWEVCADVPKHAFSSACLWARPSVGRYRDAPVLQQRAFVSSAAGLDGLLKSPSLSSVHFPKNWLPCSRGVVPKTISHSFTPWIGSSCDIFQSMWRCVRIHKSKLLSSVKSMSKMASKPVAW